jgi:DNA repair protein RadD
MITLRKYQMEATTALWDWLSNNDGNPLVVASVGAGKSVMMAQFIRDCMEGWPDTRIALVTHSAELVKQDFAKLIDIYPDCPAGIYSAGLGQRKIRSRVLVGSIQSLWRRAYELQSPAPVDILIVDECHTISRKARTMWGTFIADLKLINPNLRVVGYSGTHWRLDSGYLHEGPDRMFDGVAFEIGMIELIEQGFLCPLVTRQSKTQIDLSSVHVRGGEYVAAELEAAADAITDAAIDEVVLQGADRKTWLLFCSGRDHAFSVRDAIRARGFSCETILADTPRDERTRVLDDLRSGRLRAVTNVSTLTTGVDVPCIDLIATLRASKSASLYVQMGGRGMRLSPGKTDCLFLDFSNLIAEHGPIDQAKPKPKRKSEKPGEAPTKTCPECESTNPISARECRDCGYEFPLPDGPNIEQTASSLAILSSQMAPAAAEWVDITGVTYARHRGRDGKPDSLRVDYWAGMVNHSEWICLAHPGYARDKAYQWWRQRDPSGKVPQTIDEALTLAPALPKPASIQVRPDGKYTCVVAARFA